ncbi:acyl--CoA ligase [Streptosporangium sp. NBC_01755]|uniref:class I adenylate-forming enzyme family protein n=1 Tax=Streptosporangium sp. NBC_01755 TaxID=2975949 RepID=UPI002DDC2CCF|nr:class I adenylate-forming enzyme family protein [Streptosporangium sp. NBC_01755]WSD01823.1 acyl--CoA ligase [Streptosporangium sp. NBC_01755]
MTGSFVEVVRRHALQTPQAPAVTDPATAWSWADLWRRAHQIGGALADRGIGPGDRVGTAMDPGAEHLAVLIGIMAGGATAAPLNVKLAPAELARYLDAVRPSAIVVGDGHRPQTRVPSYLSGELVGAAASWQHHRTPGDAPTIVFGTGGTTGTPRGAVWSTAGLADYLACSALALEARRTDTELFFAPFFHIALATCALSTLYVGGGLVVEPRFDAGRAVDLLLTGRANRLFGPPTALNRILDHPAFDSSRTGHIRTVLFGSTASEPDLPERLGRGFGHATLITGYGATEFGAVARLRSWENGGRMSGIGWPVPGAELRIVSAAGEPVAAGEVGELVVRAPWQMAGYLIDGVPQPVPEEGVRSGDLAARAPDGSIELRGRLKELIITGGENVFPIEVERVLCEHPDVAQAAVVGVSDPGWGERVEAVVVPAAGSTGALVGDLDRHCRERLAGYKVPKRIVVRDAMPLTTAMKIDKLTLKRWLDEH